MDTTQTPIVPARPHSSDAAITLRQGIQLLPQKVASGQGMNFGSDTPVKGVLINNSTNQLMRLQAGPMSRFILPYTRGIRWNTWGLGNVVITVGLLDIAAALYPQVPAVIAGEFYDVTCYSRPWVSESDGEPYSPSVGPLFDNGAGGAGPVEFVATNVVDIESIGVLLSTAAGGAARAVTITLETAAETVFAQIHAGATQAASLFRFYNFSSGVVRESTFIGAGVAAAHAPDIMVPLPEPARLRPGEILAVYDENSIAGADNFQVVVHGARRFDLV